MFVCLGSLILSFTCNFFAYSKFHSDWGREIGKIKQNELDCRDTAPLSDSNLQVLFSEICIDQHSCSIHILLAKLGGGRGSTLSVFSHPLKSYFILYLSFANDLTRDLSIQNLLMFCWRQGGGKRAKSQNRVAVLALTSILQACVFVVGKWALKLTVVPFKKIIVLAKILTII